MPGIKIFRNQSGEKFSITKKLSWYNVIITRVYSGCVFQSVAGNIYIRKLRPFDRIKLHIDSIKMFTVFASGPHTLNRLVTAGNTGWPESMAFL